MAAPSVAELKQPPSHPKEAPINSDINQNQNENGSNTKNSNNEAIVVTTVTREEEETEEQDNNGRNTAASATTPKAAPAPTYESTQASDVYRVAKALLNDGDFEAAMSTIEDGIASTVEHLQACPEVEDCNLHPALAPLHYLYGSTLLYSIEESTDDTAQMGAEPSMLNLPGATSAEASGAAFQQEEEEPEQDPAEQSAEPQPDATEDLQIAFENLDLARLLLEPLVQQGETSTSAALQLDLAQVLLRLGDLQRFNGRYGGAVQDYQTCLQLRNAALSSNAPYDRRLADVHSQLALTLALWVATVNQEDKEKQQQESSPDAAVAAMAAAAPEASNDDPPPTLEELQAYRQQSVEHYVCCARIFCAQMLILTGADTSWVESTLQKAQQQASQSLPGKTTGLEDADYHNVSATASQEIQGLLQIVQNTASQPTDAQAFGELLELVQEIGETVQEAQHSEQGVHEVHAMKAEITAAAAANADGEQEQGESGGFGSQAAAAISASAAPVMVVRRKKDKRPRDAAEDATEPATKKAAAE